MEAEFKVHIIWYNWALTAVTKKIFRSCWQNGTQKAINLPADIVPVGIFPQTTKYWHLA